METTFFSKRPNSTQKSSRERGLLAQVRQVARGLTRGLGALLVRLGTQEFDSSTRVMRGTTGELLVRLGARLDQMALRSETRRA